MPLPLPRRFVHKPKQGDGSAHLARYNQEQRVQKPPLWNRLSSLVLPVLLGLPNLSQHLEGQDCCIQQEKDLVVNLDGLEISFWSPWEECLAAQKVTSH